MRLNEAIPLDDIHIQSELPLILHGDSVGYGTPADEDTPTLDLNEHLVRDTRKTFCTRARGDSLSSQGIDDGDLLIVDCTLAPQHGDIIVASQESELLCRILDLKNNCLRTADNDDDYLLALQDCPELRVEGVVMHSIKQHR